MREHEVNSMNNFIMGWYGDESISDLVIDVYNKSENKTIAAIGSGGERIVNTDIKDSIDVALGPDFLNESSYGEHLRECVRLYFEKYLYSRVNGVFPREGVNIQKYPVGGGFKVWHHERIEPVFPEAVRHFVFMTYLNDVPDGGTEFYHQGLKIRAEKGLTLIWPADWTYTHRGEISLTKEKIIATGWLHMLESKNENSDLL